MEVRDFREITLLGTTAGGAGGAVAVMFQLGFDSGDVFAFAGALVGAAATVAGAAWLSDRSGKAILRREAGLIQDECESLIDAALATTALIPAGDDQEEWTRFRQSVHELYGRAETVSAILREAMDKAQSLNFRQRVRARAAEGAILAFESFHSDVFEEEEELGWYDERTWAGQISYMTLKVEELVKELKRT